MIVFLKKSITIALIFCVQFLYSQTKELLFSYTNTSLTFEERVNDLVGRMTLEEKTSQMLNDAPAIKRLNIPAYNWWNESLHGVGRSGFKVTVFPQAIGMAATFDDEALQLMGDIRRSACHLQRSQ